MEFLLLAMLVSYYMTRNTVQDLVWKATGQDPPSYRREQERIKRRDARKPITDKREARKFWANAWADAWESAGEKRERLHNKRQKRRHEWWDQEDLAEAEDEAYERNDREPAPVPDTEPVVHDDEDATPLVRCEECKAEVPAARIQIREIADIRSQLCSTCAAKVDQVAEAKAKNWRCSRCDVQVWAEADQAGCWICRLRDTLPADQDQGQPVEPTPAPAAADTSGGAQIIQFTDLQRTAAGSPTAEENDVNGETTNLSAALAYTQNMAASCRDGVTSVETSVAGLTSGGVTGPTLDALAQAQEALAAADAAFQAAHAALERHIQVQEAYAANADAGTKEFVTAD